ncbi:NAD-binding protein, partial [Acinetobacter baumannii]
MNMHVPGLPQAARRQQGADGIEAPAMNIAVIGAGYVGLVSGTCLALLGHRVTIVDRDAQRIAMLRRGQMPIHETGLAQ